VASQWRIRHKLLLGVVLVITTTALLLGGTTRGLWSYYLTVKGIRVGLTDLRSAEEFTEAVAALSRPATAEDSRTKRSADRFDPEVLEPRLEQVAAKLAEYQGRLEDESEHKRDPDHVDHQRGTIRKLLDQIEEVKKGPAETDGKPNEGDASRLARREKAILPRLATLQLTAGDLRKTIYKHLQEQIAASHSNYQTAFWIIISASIVGLISITGLMRSFYSWVFNPIRDLDAGVKKVASGNFDHRIEVHSGDEMEELADAFNDMTGRLRDLYGDLARQVNERSRQLVRSERLASVGFLAAGVAHEINNPLASIAFCSEALEARLADLLGKARPGGRRPDDEEVFARYLKMIQEEAFRCKKITEKLLEFSRSSERKRAPTDLAALVQSVIDITQHLQSCRGKEIAFHPADGAEGLVAPVNAEEIKSVVLNLVVNALDSMTEGGRLTIGLDEHDGLAKIRFTDTGCGMTQEVLENIFEPFFTRSRTGKGTGLGLTISHRIVTQHGGEIEATSDGPNRGSTFVVRLPLTDPESAVPPTLPLERGRRAA
jgi:signal transduction histidine kinase